MSAEKAEEGEFLKPPTVLTLSEIVENSEKAVTKLVPKASKQINDNTYKAFMEWRKVKDVSSFSE